MALTYIHYPNLVVYIQNFPSVVKKMILWCYWVMTIHLKPIFIVKCNAFMKGGDHGDHTLSYYLCKCKKTLRWYKKNVIHILQMLLNNSHLFSNMSKNYTMNFGWLYLNTSFLWNKNLPNIPVQIIPWKKSKMPLYELQEKKDKM